MLFAIAASLLLSAAGPAERPTLTGVVQDANGKPVAGALVFIATAKPRQGTSAACPSCYLDCRKRATTGTKGEFALPKVDPSLLFRVGAVAEGHMASFQADVDPVAGPTAIKLGALPPIPDDPRRLFRGRLVDADGSPVLGAIVEPRGRQTERMSTFGPMGVETTVTGEGGRFAFVLPEGADSLFLAAETPGFAPKAFARIPTGTAENTLRMGPGRALHGRLVREGRPVAGAMVGVAQVDRNAESFVGERTAETGPDGRFLLPNLPPDEKLVFYGKVESLGARGALGELPIEGEPESGVRDLGDVELAPSLTLSGRLTLGDGRPVPPTTRIFVNRLSAWDSVEQVLAVDGTFRIVGLPRETLSVSIRLPGYELATENESLEPDYSDTRSSLAGRLDEDTHIEILAIPVGDRTPQPPPRTAEEWQAFNARTEAIRSKPLRGARKLR